MIVLNGGLPTLDLVQKFNTLYHFNSACQVHRRQVKRDAFAGFTSSLLRCLRSRPSASSLSDGPTKTNQRHYNADCAGQTSPIVRQEFNHHACIIPASRNLRNLLRLGAHHSPSLMPCLKELAGRWSGIAPVVRKAPLRCRHAGPDRQLRSRRRRG